jgi:hypothetical protein
MAPTPHQQRLAHLHDPFHPHHNVPHKLQHLPVPLAQVNNQLLVHTHELAQLSVASTPLRLHRRHLLHHRLCTHARAPTDSTHANQGRGQNPNANNANNANNADKAATLTQTIVLFLALAGHLHAPRTAFGGRWRRGSGRPGRFQLHFKLLRPGLPPGAVTSVTLKRVHGALHRCMQRGL